MKKLKTNDGGLTYTSIENCGVCGKPHECTAVSGKGIDQGVKGGCTGVVCDNLPKEGCLRHFCKECIGLHKCSNAYGEKEKRKKR